jgi:prepilin-type processing-associated H-X9-DG protein
MQASGNKNWAFTLVELVVVVAMVAVLAATLLPAMARVRGASQQTVCADNLKQVGVAFQTWSASHFNNFPMNVTSDQGGPPNQTAFYSSGARFGAAYMCQVFGVMSNQLKTPRILVCPADERAPHTNFLTVANNNFPPGQPGLDDTKISYFLGGNAIAVNPRMLLCGDRNIYGSAPGLATLPPVIPNNGYGNGPSTEVAMGTNFTGAATPCWTPTKMHLGQGNVLFTDGSAQTLTTSALRQRLQSSGDMSFMNGPNGLLFP